MPELPEVENIRLTLERTVLGKTIKDIRIFWSASIITWKDSDFYTQVKGKKFESIDRRGKYLLVNLSQGWTLIIHFRMTGRLVFYPGAKEPDKHTHVIFDLEDGELHYSDIRKFGRIQLVPTKRITEVSSLAKLGPELLQEGFAFDQFGNRLSRKKTSIKAALLDQRVVAGLGNIYVDESLFRAGILPERGTQTLKVSEIILLHDAVQEVLRQGIEAGGTSFRDYRDADGNRGSFQESLMVYGRGGLECKLCGQILEKKKIAGRATVFCTNCQK